MRAFKDLMFGFVGLCHVIHAQNDQTCQKILSYAQEKLPQSGMLKETDGFVYVKIDDAYIHQLVNFIKDQGYVEPPYFGDPTLVGAHISVISAKENKGVKVQEVGKRFEFKIKGCGVVHPPNLASVDDLYLITVEAPALNEIRKRYGLPKSEYDYHITIGVKLNQSAASVF